VVVADILHLITASFDQEEKAVEAFTKLQELEKIGDITIYEMVVVAKNDAGEASIVEALTAEGTQTLPAMAVGTIVGALAGPVGMVTGMLLKEHAAEADVKVAGKEKKIGRIRGKIEKHQKKIAELEQKLAGVLQKEKEEVKEPEEQ
jgi:hypothetical protein